jgi:hypothetical protein
MVGEWKKKKLEIPSYSIEDGTADEDHCFVIKIQCILL